MLVAITVTWDHVASDRGFLHESAPEWSPPQLLRSAALAVAATVFVLAGRRAGRRSRRVTDSRPITRPQLAAIVAGNAVALVAAALVVVAPETLTRLAQEDGLVEWSSAGLAFLASALFGFGAWQVARSPAHPDRRPVVTMLAVGAGLCLLVGLEEVSWFQRVLGVDSPEMFQGRNQPEFNIHNGATDESENLYYMGGFVATVLLPGLLAGHRLPDPFRSLEIVVPAPWVMYGSAAASAVVYEMWNIVGIQLVLFVTVALLATEQRKAGPLPVVVLAVVIVVAGLFLGYGSNMTRSWDDTEVRELLLPYGLCLWALDIVRRTSARSRSRYRSPSQDESGRSARSSAQVTRRKSSIRSAARPSFSA